MPIKNIELSELAQKELEEAVLYYEMEQSGLGLRFKDQVRLSIQRIKKYPTSWPIERGQVRKFIVQRFPYKILYSIQKQNIII
jgi:toxin ParE2